MNKKFSTPGSLSNTQTSNLFSLSLSRIWLLKRDCTEQLALPAAEEQIILSQRLLVKCDQNDAKKVLKFKGWRNFLNHVARHSL